MNVKVPGRVNDWADLVLYADDNLSVPLLLVESKKEGISPAQRKQAIDQATGYVNRLGAPYALFDCQDDSLLFALSAKSPRKELGTRESLPDHVGGEAYVLLEIEPPFSPDISRSIIEKHRGVLYAAAVWGSWDAILHVQKPSLNEVTQMVTEIQTMPHVFRTQTYIVKVDQGTTTVPIQAASSSKWAFVFLKVRASRVRDVLQTLRQEQANFGSGSDRAQIQYIGEIYGPYDIAVTVRYSNDSQLNALVMHEIQRLERGVAETSTIPAVDGLVFTSGLFASGRS